MRADDPVGAIKVGLIVIRIGTDIGFPRGAPPLPPAASCRRRESLASASLAASSLFASQVRERERESRLRSGKKSRRRSLDYANLIRRARFQERGQIIAITRLLEGKLGAHALIAINKDDK